MEEKKYIVSFPHLGNYYVPIYNLLKNILDLSTTQILIPRKITKKTIELGANVSPDFVCIPFKYNMGNYIESLEMGANVLIQAGGGCRYGYYAEVQEQILRDLGYDFTYITLLDDKRVNVKKVYKKFKNLNPKLRFSTFVYQFALAAKMIDYLDKFETYIRENIVLESKKGTFENLHKSFLDALKNIKTIEKLMEIRNKYFKELYSIKLINEQDDLIKIGIVGELYTSMEPFASFFLEKELSNLGAKVKRYTTVTYLLFKKGFSQKKLLKFSKDYIEYALGADGTESVAHTLELIENGYDGIIHIKPFGCAPEVNAMPILHKICEDKDIPMMYLTFDSQTSQTGIKTRIEAFYDMLKMKKESMEEA